MNEIFKKRIKQSIIDNGLSDTLQVTDIFLDDALNIVGKDYIRQNLHKLLIDLKDYVLADLGWYGGVGINELYGWDENIDFMQTTDRLAIITYVSLEGIDYTWYDVDMEENMGDMSMSWNDKKLIERPEVMIELFNFLCDFYRERFEGGREDDRFMMEETNLRDKIKRILKEEIKKSRKSEIFQKIVDLKIEDMRRICATQSAEPDEPDGEIISFSACDYLFDNEPKVRVTTVDTFNDVLRILVVIEFHSARGYEDEEYFIYELQNLVREFVGDKKLIIQVEDTINRNTKRQW